MAIKKLKANGHIVQADWGQTDSKKMDYIHNKPEIFDGDYNSLKNKPTIPDTSELLEAVDSKVATKTSVTVGGVHQETFDADTKYTKLAINNNYDRAAIIGAGKDSLSTMILSRTSGSISNDRIVVYSPTGRSETIMPTNGYLVCSVPKFPADAANKKYVDTNFIKSTADLQTITGSLTITGDLTIKGTTKTQDAQTQLIEENIIELNSGKVLNETQLSGVVINKDNTSAYGIVYDPSSDAVKLGLGTTNNGEFSFNSNEGTPIATREEYNKNWADDAIFVFDRETKKFKYSGKTLASFEEEIMTKMRAEMDTFVKDYVETYMSDIEIEHDDGTTEKVSKMIFGDNYEEKQNGTELWIKEN